MKAIDRGIYFELLYTPAIKDSTMRRYTISNAISLMQICKGKVSSQSESKLINLVQILLELCRLSHFKWVLMIGLLKLWLNLCLLIQGHNYSGSRYFQPCTSACFPLKLSNCLVLFFRITYLLFWSAVPRIKGKKFALELKCISLKSSTSKFWFTKSTFLKIHLEHWEKNKVEILFV